uniref:Anterior gradient 1 n=2 Tax=Electrophorus electricus TaxID=8005 RepID=A0A4W4FKW0_ELEEL
MVIHHLEDCPHSQALRKVFAENKDIQRLTKEFIMLNLVHETGDDNLAPDGYYVPRILFIDPSKTVRGDITGKYANHMYTYEPTDMDVLMENMIKAKILLHSEL